MQNNDIILVVKYEIRIFNQPSTVTSIALIDEVSTK